MRVIGEVNHPECKITLFHWNNRYLVKIEQDLLEQTFKIPEYDIPTEDEVRRLVSDEFVAAALHRFGAMRQSLHDALEKI